MARIKEMMNHSNATEADKMITTWYMLSPKEKFTIMTQERYFRHVAECNGIRLTGSWANEGIVPPDNHPGHVRNFIDESTIEVK